MEIVKGGMRLLWSTLVQMTANLKIAFYVAVPLYVVSLLPGFITGPLGSMIFDVISLGIFLLLICWLSIAWHRRLVLGEPRDELIVYNGTRIVRYFKVLIKLFVVAGAIFGGFVLLQSIFLKFAMGFQLDFANDWVKLVFWFVPIVIFNYVSYRIGVILPAIALDRSMTISQALGATRPIHVSILVASILLTIISVATEFLFSEIGYETLFIIILMPVANCFALIFGLTMLTVLFQRMTELKLQQDLSV